MFTLNELEKVIPLVRASVPPTPQYAWPLLKVLTGVQIVVKHENHAPIGAFKVRAFVICASLIRQFEFAQNVWARPSDFGRV